jgi:hypothetical protein
MLVFGIIFCVAAFIGQIGVVCYLWSEMGDQYGMF